MAKKDSKHFIPISLESLYQEGVGEIDIVNQHPVRIDNIEEYPYIFEPNNF